MHSLVFPWIVEHATDILNKCHVASDGKSAYGRLKRRQHRGLFLPFGTAVMFRVAGKVPGGVMTEIWHLGTWLGKRFRTEEHIVARRGDGLVIRSKAVKVMLQETLLEELDAIKGSPWALSCVLRDVLLDVPRPIRCRDEPPFAPIEERPSAKEHENLARYPKKVQVVPNAGNCLAKNTPIQAWHILRIVAPGSKQQAGQTRCMVTVLSVQNQRKMGVCAREAERFDNPRRASLEPSVVPAPPTEEKEGEGAGDAKRASGEPEQVSGEIPIPSADDTLTTPKIPVLPSVAIPSISTSIPISPGISSSSGMKRTYSESTALPNSPGVSSGSGVKRAHGERRSNLGHVPGFQI